MNNNDSITEEEYIQTTQIYKEYDNGQTYLNNLGLIRDTSIFVDFYEGRQWSTRISNDTRHIPRIVHNVVKKICDSTITNILSKKYKLNYKTDNLNDSAQRFNAFAEFQLSNMRQSALDCEAVKSGVVKGTYVLYYYWNIKAMGMMGNYEGSPSGQVLDPLKVVFADPTEKDVQKQEYIICSHTESVKSVRDLCDKDSKRKLVVPDYENEIDNYGQVKQEDGDLVTIYTKFFRIDDEVYFQNSTKTVVLHEPKALNPDVTYIKIKKSDQRYKDATHIDGKNPKELIVDGKVLSIPREIQANDTSNDNKCIYYPFEVGSFIDRENSIYGISEVQDIKEVQKAINYVNTYSILSVQKQGIPKMIVKKGALKGQRPDNSIDQYLTDYTPDGVKGIDYLQVQPFTQGALQLVPQLYNFVRDVTNSNELVTSDMVSKELSGTAISLLTANSDKTVDVSRKKYWRSIERVGRILEQFLKHCYKEPFKYSFNINDTTRQELQKMDEQNFIKAKQSGMDYTPRQFSNMMEDEFKSDEYKDTRFVLSIEAGEGTQYSEAQSIYMLNNMLANGLIDQKLYVKLCPASAMSFKNEMLDEIEKREQEEVIQLRQEKAELTEQLQQLSNYIKQLQTTNKDITSALNDSLTRNKAMQNEYASKITQARDILLNQQKAQQNKNNSQQENEKNFANKQMPNESQVE